MFSQKDQALSPLKIADGTFDAFLQWLLLPRQEYQRVSKLAVVFFGLGKNRKERHIS
jgi:hypothetical protein